MKKSVRIGILIILAALTLCSGALAVTVEQVQVCMPSVDVYMYEEGHDLEDMTAEDVTASLGGEQLRVLQLDKSEQGIFYIYMLDVSGSMPKAHFDAAKQAIIEAYDRLREQDSLTLITFGNDVRLHLKGGENRSRVEQTVAALENNDTRTKFYTAMNALVDIASETEDMRRVAVVISDGVDDTDAGMTQRELEQVLLRSGVSVNGLCIDTSTADVESFSEIISISGGELFTYSPEDASEVMDSMLDRLDGGWLLRLEASSNIASGEDTPLTVVIGESNTLELTVRPTRYTPDESRPRVTSAKLDTESKTVDITFSEPVMGIDNAAAYSVSGLAVEKVEATGADSCRITLAGEMPAQGELTLKVSGLTDISMESNPLYEYSGVIWREAAVTAAPVETPQAEEPLIDKSVIIFFGIVIFVLIAAVSAIVIISSKKKTAAEKERPKEQRAKPDAVKSTATFMFLGDSDKEEKEK